MAILFAFALLGSACVEERNAPAEGATAAREIVKIGLTGPFSGIAASIGRNMREGVVLAVDELNAAGGVLTRRIEVVARDNENDPAKASQIVRELIDQEGISVLIGPPFTTAYLAIDGLIREKKMVTMPIVTGPQIKEKINPYTFRIMIPDDIQVDLLVGYALPRYSRIGIIAEDNETGRSQADQVTAEMAKKVAKPVATEFFATDELDLKPVVLKVQKAGADAVVIGSHVGPYAARITSAAGALGYKPQFLGLVGLTSYTFPDLAKDLAIGTIFVGPPIPQTVGAANLPETAQAFYKAYTTRFFQDGTRSESGADKVTGAAYLTYDAVRMWATAAKKAGSTDPQKVADVFNAGFDYGPKESSANVAWHYDAKDHEGIHKGDMWFYKWSKTDKGIEFSFLGDAKTLAGS